jgi:hypothetical protein
MALWWSIMATPATFTASSDMHCETLREKGKPTLAPFRAVADAVVEQRAARLYRSSR